MADKKSIFLDHFYQALNFFLYSLERKNLVIFVTLTQAVFTIYLQTNAKGNVKWIQIYPPNLKTLI